MIRPLLATALAVTISLPGQDPPVRALGARLPPSVGPFIEIAGVRELRDERVIVLDKQDRSLHVVDLRSGNASPLGRDGDGPGEYRLPLRILALAGDSTAVYDMGNSGRFVVYAPDGKPARPIPIEYRGSSGAAEATDAQGRLYTAERGVRGLADRYLGKIVRWDRNTGRRDSIATMSFQLVSPLPVPLGPVTVPFWTRDQWAVAPDGRVAVVQVEPYRVTLYHPDGSRVVGPLVPVDRIRVSNGHKEEWREDWKRPRGAIIGTEYTFRRLPVPEPSKWPEYLPPFMPDAVRFASDGMLWIRRTTGAGAPATFDIIDAQGRVAAKLELPTRTRLVGFGNGTIYLARTDDQEMEYLDRYRLP